MAIKRRPSYHTLTRSARRQLWKSVELLREDGEHVLAAKLLNVLQDLESVSRALPHTTKVAAPLVGRCT